MILREAGHKPTWIIVTYAKQNKIWLHRRNRYAYFIVFNKMKNKLTFVTVVRKIPNRFHTREYLHTFIGSPTK